MNEKADIFRIQNIFGTQLEMNYVKFKLSLQYRQILENILYYFANQMIFVGIIHF